MKIKEYLVMGSLLAIGACVLVSCGSHEAGADVSWFHSFGHWSLDFFGANTPDGELSGAEKLFAWGDMLVPGLGTLSVGLAALARRAMKTQKALFESTQAAIKSGSLTSAKTQEAVKKAFNKAQKLHHDSKLIATEYDKFKNGGGIKKAKDAILGAPKALVDVVKKVFK